MAPIHDPDTEPETPRTPYTRLEQEIICLRRDVDRIAVETAHNSRLLIAFTEHRSTFAGMTTKQRAGLLAGVGSALTTCAYLLYEGAQTLKELLHLLMQLKGINP